MKAMRKLWVVAVAGLALSLAAWPIVVQPQESGTDLKGLQEKMGGSDGMSAQVQPDDPSTNRSDGLHAQVQPDDPSTNRSDGLHAQVQPDDPSTNRSDGLHADVERKDSSAAIG
jgi:hypothetical protein